MRIFSSRTAELFAAQNAKGLENRFKVTVEDLVPGKVADSLAKATNGQSTSGGNSTDDFLASLVAVATSLKAIAHPVLEQLAARFDQLPKGTQGAASKFFELFSYPALRSANVAPSHTNWGDALARGGR